MKTFLKNNLCSIFNMGLLVLVFTYPITDINRLENKEVNANPYETLKISNSKIENTKEINFKSSNSFGIKATSNTEDMLQTGNIFFIKNNLYSPIPNH